MLKKAGIVVAGSAAALLALSPLAFAGEAPSHWSHPHGQNTAQVNNRSDNKVNYVGDRGSHSTGLIAVGDVNALNNLNVCPSTALPVGIGDVLGILSPGQGVAGGVASGDPVCVNDNSISQSNAH